MVRDSRFFMLYPKRLMGKRVGGLGELLLERKWRNHLIISGTDHEAEVEPKLFTLVFHHIFTETFNLRMAFCVHKYMLLLSPIHLFP